MANRNRAAINLQHRKILKQEGKAVVSTFSSATSSRRAPKVYKSPRQQHVG